MLGNGHGLGANNTRNGHGHHNRHIGGTTAAPAFTGTSLYLIARLVSLATGGRGSEIFRSGLTGIVDRLEFQADPIHETSSGPRLVPVVPAYSVLLSCDVRSWQAVISMIRGPNGRGNVAMRGDKSVAPLAYGFGMCHRQRRRRCRRWRLQTGPPRPGYLIVLRTCCGYRAQCCVVDRLSGYSGLQTGNRQARGAVSGVVGEHKASHDQRTARHLEGSSN